MRPLAIVIIVLLAEIAAVSIISIAFISLGIFNVSTQWRDPAPAYELFKTVRLHSIERRAASIHIPNGMDLQDPKLIRSGFNIYVRSCMMCHEGPGMKPNEYLREGLYPKPPDFSHKTDLQLNPQELFWVIKNGIRMTGMPAWGPSKSNRQIWALVAYVSSFPNEDQNGRIPNSQGASK